MAEENKNIYTDVKQGDRGSGKLWWPSPLVAENTETISNLRQQLDAVGFKLVTEFTELDLERPTKVNNAYYEIVDGVLQFFFNIDVFAVPQINEAVKLNEYELNEEVI